MKYFMYSIFDTVTKEFGPPWIAKNNRVAQRQFQQMMDKEFSDNIAKEDFRILCIGEFDNESETPILGRYPDFEVGENVEE